MRFLLASFAMVLSFSAFAQDLKNASDSLYYALGVEIAKDLEGEQHDMKRLNKVLQQGIKDAMKGEDLKIEAKDSKMIIRKFEKSKKERMLEANKIAGEQFLAENAKRAEVTVLESGVQYEVMTKGTGAVSPSISDQVTTHYHGMLIDGSVFDSSVQRGEPIAFRLNQVIRGWQEGLSQMKEGDKWKLYIPYDLAYGARGSAPVIPPYSALIFEVELIKIN